MRRIVRSEGWARTRVVIGAIATVLGCVVIARTAASVGAIWAALPAYVLGVALVGLGFVRFFEYRAWRRAR